MLLKRAPQLSQPVDELVAILRLVLQLEQQLSGQLVVIQRVGHERLRLLILPQDGENVLLLKPRQQFKLFLEVGKEALAGLQRSEGLFAKLRKKFIGFRWTVLNQLSDRGHCASGGDRQPALCVLPFDGEVGFWGRSDASEPTAINGSEKARPATQHPCTTRLSNRSSVQLTTRRCSRAHVPTRSRGHACAIYEFSSASGAALRAGSRSRGPASRSRHLCRDPPCVGGLGGRRRGTSAERACRRCRRGSAARVDRLSPASARGRGVGRAGAHHSAVAHNDANAPLRSTDRTLHSRRPSRAGPAMIGLSLVLLKPGGLRSRACVSVDLCGTRKIVAIVDRKNLVEGSEIAAISGDEHAALWRRRPLVNNYLDCLCKRHALHCYRRFCALHIQEEVYSFVIVEFT